MRAHTHRDLAFNTPHTQTHVRMNTRSCGRRVKYHTRPCTLRHIRTSAHACARANTYLPSSLCPSSFPPMSILQVTSSCGRDWQWKQRDESKIQKVFFASCRTYLLTRKLENYLSVSDGNPRFDRKSTCSSNHMFHRLPKLKRLIFSPPSGGGKFA
jgi:hypothetical protein